jgi:sugar phosphate isomerase/epimerase
MSHCYWAVVSCKDPKTIIVKYRNRILSIHIKDGKEVDDKFVNTVIGEGIIDYEGIVAIAKKFALNWLTVEQEQFSLDVVESIRLNFDRLKAINNRTPILDTFVIGCSNMAGNSSSVIRIGYLRVTKPRANRWKS